MPIPTGVALFLLIFAVVAQNHPSRARLNGAIFLSLPPNQLTGFFVSILADFVQDDTPELGTSKGAEGDRPQTSNLKP